MAVRWVRCLLKGLLWVVCAASASASCPWAEPAKTQFIRQGASKQLVIFLHAYNSQPGDLCQAVQTLLSTPGQQDSDVWVPAMPLHTFSRTPPAELVAQLVADLDARWRQGGPKGKQSYESLLMVGHSLGSLLARKLYITGLGEHASAPLEPDLDQALRARAVPSFKNARDWALKTRRIVLMAGINRGWSINHHMSWSRGLLFQSGVWLNRWVRAATGRDFTIFAAHKGSGFLTQLRLQWLALPQRWSALGNPAGGLADTVQLLGSVDDLVPPSDNIDPVTGGSFTYYRVLRSNHENVVQMQRDEATPPDLEAPALRAKEFRRALTPSLAPSDSVPQSIRQSASPDKSVEHVVFVMHGIRDEGFWTERVATEIEQQLHAVKPPGPDGRSRVAFEVSSYGFFPILSFLQPGARQAKVAWLLDRYTEAKARYPNAKSFHYVGHSHGTYLLKEALVQQPAVRFDRVVLAGSVLRTTEDWLPLLNSGQIQQLLNFRASNDLVVAVFPYTMQRFGVQDLGGAGHLGFERQDSRVINAPSGGRLVAGGHGTAVEEHAWRAIGSFVAQGKLDETGLPVVNEHTPLADWAGKWGGVVWGAIAGVLLLGFWLLLRWRVRESIKTLGLVAYLGLIWSVLTGL
jgi:hypothetical protein